MTTQQQLRRKRTAELNYAALVMEREFLTEAELVLGRSLKHCRLTPLNRLRLLTLRSWMIRYKVSLGYILERLLLDKYKSLTKRSKGLGVTIPTLLGLKSQRYLEECIVRDFPAEENVTEWRRREQERLLSVRLPDFPTSQEDVDSYARRIESIRRQLQRKAELFRRRPWRMNPWR